MDGTRGPDLARGPDFADPWFMGFSSFEIIAFRPLEEPIKFRSEYVM